VRNRRIGGTGFRVISSEEEEDEMEAMAVGGVSAVMVVADRAMAMEVPAYRHPVPSWRRSSGATAAPVMTALVGIRCLSLRVAHLLVLAAGESPTMERQRKAYGELPCRGATARGWRLPCLVRPALLLSLPPANGCVIVELISSPLHVPSSVPQVGGEVRVRQLGPHVGTFRRETTVVLPAKPKGGRTKAGGVALTGFLGVEKGLRPR
jgi:hypothetical protein